MWQKVILDFTGEKRWKHCNVRMKLCLSRETVAHVFGWWVNDGYPASLVTMVMDWMSVTGKLAGNDVTLITPPAHFTLHWWCMQSKSGKMRQTLCVRNRFSWQKQTLNVVIQTSMSAIKCPNKRTHVWELRFQERHLTLLFVCVCVCVCVYMYVNHQTNEFVLCCLDPYIEKFFFAFINLIYI